MNDPVNHPKHYTSHPSGIECIQVTEYMNFNLGNAIKYIWRAGDKGNLLEDLLKAQWYLNREIERIKKAITVVERGQSATAMDAGRGRASIYGDRFDGSKTPGSN